MSFNRKTCKELLLSSRSWDTIDELWETVKDTEGVIDEDFFKSAGEKAGKQELRSVLNEVDPQTGLPLAASLIGEDGERRYKPTKLFDDTDYRKVINDRYKRFTNMAREIRHWEQAAGIPPAEQLSLDLSWIDEAEDAA